MSWWCDDHQRLTSRLIYCERRWLLLVSVITRPVNPLNTSQTESTRLDMDANVVADVDADLPLYLFRIRAAHQLEAWED